MVQYDAPPPYDPSGSPTTQRRLRPANISDIPLHVLHRIVSLTLDPRATPSRFSGDDEEERVRRMWGLFLGLRGVDRRFYLVSTSILRTTYLPDYLANLPRGTSTDPYPTSSHPYYSSSSSSGQRKQTSERPPSASPSPILARTRETQIFDRFISIHLGHLLRQTESSLSEPSEALPDLFKRLQPAARIEDLLKTLPADLVMLQGEPKRQIPLPWTHLSVGLTPGWVGLYLNSGPVGREAESRGGRGRDLVIEVRRQGTAEENVRMLGEGLEDMVKGVVRWGERVL